MSEHVRRHYDLNPQWDGERWLPITAATKTLVEVEGIVVLVAWAEEEFLATVRRGRMDRAAWVLPYLDRDRLMALLRHEVRPGMIQS